MPLILSRLSTILLAVAEDRLSKRLEREVQPLEMAGLKENSANEVLGISAQDNGFGLGQTQRDAWLEEIHALKTILQL